MDGFTIGILINIFSTGMWVLGGVLLVKLYNIYTYQKDTLFNRFAQMSQRIKLVHLTYGLVDADINARTAMEGDVSAICSALSLLHGRFGKKKISVLSPSVALSEFGTIDNLISVSGPLWNPITRALLDSSLIPVSFKEENGDDILVDNIPDSPKIYKTIRKSNIPRECYALVYRGSWETPSDGKKRHFVVAAGISPLGTYGAVTWLRKCSTQRLKNDQFIKSLKKDEHAIVILRVRDKSPAGFQAYSAGPDTPGFFTIDTINQYRASDTETLKLKSIHLDELNNVEV